MCVDGDVGFLRGTDMCSKCAVEKLGNDFLSTSPGYLKGRALAFLRHFYRYRCSSAYPVLIL